MSATILSEYGFHFLVLGRPTGKGRPRFNRKTGTAHTPKETILAENTVRLAWEQAGATFLDGPISLNVLLAVRRPQGHFKKDGTTLSKAGLAMPYPHRQKPDVDNVLKMLCDALNTRAWADDVQVVHAKVERVWDRREYTRVVARVVQAPLDDVMAA